MTFEEQIKAIQSLSTEAAERIDGLIVGVDKRINPLQKEFLSLFLEKIVLKLKEVNGVVVMNKANLQVIAQMDQFFTQFRSLFFDSELKFLAADLLQAADLSREYFEATGFSKKKLDQITAAVTDVENAIGVSGKTLIKGGYLDRLAKTDLLKHELYGIVTNALASNLSLSDFTKAMRLRIVGNKDADGFLQAYYRTYVYDSFNKVHEVSNKAFADGLGLKHFIYTGSLIATSRDFCDKRAGKAFSVEETKKWKDDADLIDKKTKATYNPLVERGRYNCRHFIKYISEDLFYHMRPDLKRK